MARSQADIYGGGRGVKLPCEVVNGEVGKLVGLEQA